MTCNRLNGHDVRNPLTGESGNVRQILLLVLLIIVAAFAYLYFFTGMIKPNGETPQAPKSVVVKQPIPPRPEQSAATQAASAPGAQTAVAAKPEAAPAKPAAQPAAEPPKVQKPAPVKAETAPVTQAPAKPAPAPVNVQKAPTAKPSAVTAKAAVPAKTEPKTAAAKQKQPVKKEVVKPVAAAKPAVKKTAGSFTLSIGTYVVEKSMAADKAKLKKAGLSPVVKKGAMKPEPMIRLYLATFNNYDEAAAELKKLRQSSGDGFFVPEGDNYAVYAGSYYLERRAAIEQDRLSDKGIKTVMKKVNVQIPTLSLTAGNFSTREDATQAVARLKKLGVSATVVQIK